MPSDFRVTAVTSYTLEATQSVTAGQLMEWIASLHIPSNAVIRWDETDSQRGGHHVKVTAIVRDQK